MGVQAWRTVCWLRPSPGRRLAGLDWTGLRMGSWEFVEGGGDLEMSVPGLASFLAFLSRPQTPGVLRLGRVDRQRGAS